MGRTGLTVVAVHTAPGHMNGITAAENMGIVALFIGHIVLFYHLQHFFHGVAADDHNFYTVAVQTILNTLKHRYGHTKGELSAFSSVPAPKGFITVIATPLASQAE